MLITGADDAEQMREKVEIARTFESMDEGEMKDLIERVSDRAGNIVEFYKQVVAPA